MQDIPIPPPNSSPTEAIHFTEKKQRFGRRKNKDGFSFLNNDHQQLEDDDDSKYKFLSLNG